MCFHEDEVHNHVARRATTVVSKEALAVIVGSWLLLLF